MTDKPHFSPSSLADDEAERWMTAFRAAEHENPGAAKHGVQRLENALRTLDIEPPERHPDDARYALAMRDALFHLVNGPEASA